MKRTFWHVRQKKTQISLRIRAVWSEFSLSIWRDFASLTIQNAPSEESDQTAQTRRLIWILAGRTCPNAYFLELQLIWTPKEIVYEQMDAQSWVVTLGP